MLRRLVLAPRWAAPARTGWACALGPARGVSSDAAHRTAEHRARRQLRVGSKIQRVLADLLQEKIATRTMGVPPDVLITHVSTSGDLRAATVYWLPSPTSRVPADRITTALKRQARPLSVQLANTAKLRWVPRLSFVHDDRLLQAHRVSDLIDALGQEAAERAADAAEPPQPASGNGAHRGSPL